MDEKLVKMMREVMKSKRMQSVSYRNKPGTAQVGAISKAQK